MTRIAVILGSVRPNRAGAGVAEWVVDQANAAEGVQAELVDLAAFNLPVFVEEIPPMMAAPKEPAAVAWNEALASYDAYIVVTPEYNRSIPGALKNALDVGSRPYGHSVWSGKPAAIVSGSPGALGAFGANHHLRQPLVFLNMPTMQQPEAYIGNVADLLDENGKLKKDDTRKFLNSFTDAFAAWIDKTKA